ncbi:autophagy protein, partial [Coemansia sp. RSA 2618]
ASTDRCKRCSCKLDFSGPEWDKLTADSISTLLQTLPEERSSELYSVLSANHRGASLDATEISRFFNNSFRADTATRKPNGTIADSSPASEPAKRQQQMSVKAAQGMKGSLALVLDSSSSEQSHGSPTPDKQTPRAKTATESARLLADPSTSQSESFILLSSSQIHPQTLSSDIMRMSISGVGDEKGERRDSARRDAGGLSESIARIQEGAQAGRQDDISETFGVIGRFVDALDERSAMAHPMCEDCAEIMMRLLDREVSDHVREREILEGIGRAAALIAPITEGGDGSPAVVSADVAELEQEIARQGDLERALNETLGILDEQLDAICAQIGALSDECRDLDAEHAQRSQDSNDASLVLERCEAEQWALDEKYARLAAQLTQLQRTNVFNDVFNIAVHDGVASINGFRLGGRSSPHNVEWAEINTAWGQALLLLQTVARKLAYEFVGFRLIPMGSFSRIERVEQDDVGDAGPTPVTLELFGSGDLYLGRLFQNRRFDAAMVAYLACLDQIAQVIMSINPQLRVPYRVEQDRVGSVSIKPQFGQDDVWTKACRNTLMDARWALAFASSYDPQ